MLSASGLSSRFPPATSVFFQRLHALRRVLLSLCNSKNQSTNGYDKRSTGNRPSDILHSARSYDILILRQVPHPKVRSLCSFSNYWALLSNINAVTRLMIDITRSSILFGSIFITASLLSSFLNSSIPSIIDFVKSFSYGRRFFAVFAHYESRFLCGQGSRPRMRSI